MTIDLFQLHANPTERYTDTKPQCSLPSTVAEFFAGIGLMRLGLERSGWNVQYANDIDPQKQQMYADNFPEDNFVLSDIHLIDPATVPTVTLATASFPCTDLSLAGGRAGLTGKQSGAFWGFMDILIGMGERRPPIVLLENVPGFLTVNRGQDFHQAIAALDGLGYAIDVIEVDAACFVPQSRKRIFVIATLGGHKRGMETCPVFTKLRSTAITTCISDHPDINWRLRELPDLPKISGRLSDILDDLPVDVQEWWGEPRSAYLLSQMEASHRTEADDLIAANNWSYRSVSRRTRKGICRAEMRSDELATCLRTPKGGSSQQILIKAGFGKYLARLLTPRECARLMGADNFVIDVPRTQALFGFGDAVCVPVVEWISRNYLMPLLAAMNGGEKADWEQM